MTRSCLLVSALLCALSLAPLGCDDAREPTTAPPPAKPSEAATEAPAPDEVEPKPEEATAPAPEPKPEPPKGPSCDRRGSNAEGAANFTCIDYGEHRGALEPRCAEGLSLSESGCPREAIVAHCVLPTTGVRFFYYEGVELDAATRECVGVDGNYVASPPA